MEMTTINQSQNIKLKNKELFTDSFNICWELLKNANCFLSERKNNLYSDLSITHGHNMYKAMMTIMDNIIKSDVDIIVDKKSDIEYKFCQDDNSFHDIDDLVFDTDLNEQQEISQMTSHSDKITFKKNKTTSHFNYPNNKRFKQSEIYDPLLISNDPDITEDKNFNSTVVINDEEIDNKDVLAKNEIINPENLLKIEIQLDELSKDDKKNLKKKRQIKFKKNINSTRTSCRIRNHNNKKINKTSLNKNKSERKNINKEKNNDKNKNKNDNEELNENETITLETKITNDIPFEIKRQIVLMAKENPSWSLTKLSKHFGLKNMIQHSVLKRWEKQLNRGGTRRDMIGLLNHWVYEKCIDYKKQNKKITNQQIKDWGVEAKKVLMLDNLKFIASDAWRFAFKEKYKITGNIHDLKIESNVQKIDTLLRVYVPQEMKIKIINLANDHPDWTIEKLKKESGCEHILSTKQVKDWKYIIKNDSS